MLHSFIVFGEAGPCDSRMVIQCFYGHGNETKLIIDFALKISTLLFASNATDQKLDL